MASDQNGSSSNSHSSASTPLIESLTRVLDKAVLATRAAPQHISNALDPTPFDPMAPLRAFTDLTAALIRNPTDIWNIQLQHMREWTALCVNSATRASGQEAEPVIAPDRSDRRFKDAAWNDQPSFEMLKQAYLLLSRQTQEMIARADLDDSARTRVDFFARQWMQALSPANFVFTNPEAIRKAFDSNGASLLAGLGNLLEDSASASGLVQRRAQDNFELGVTLATTPGAVVFQNELMQLIQYSPSTDTVYRRPVLYVPPLVNRFYLVDLQPKSSLIKWLVDQGHTVFVISWVNPGAELADKGVADYLKLGPIAALKTIESLTGERQIDVFAFCMGGTLAAMAAAYLTSLGEGDRLASLTMIGTLIDFAEMGEWATFVEPEQVAAFNRHIAAKGVIGSDKLQALFSVVRANDLIWASVVNHYLLDREAPPSDILFWFADGARIPGAFLMEYVDMLLTANKLRESGAIMIEGVPLNLKDVQVPVMLVSLKDDHVSGWAATYRGAQLFGGDTTFLLGGSGHNAGLINPPSADKHGYWTNPALPASAEIWLEGAVKNEGSWWPEWQRWMADKGDNAQVPQRRIDVAQAIEAAPGSYVRAA